MGKLEQFEEIINTDGHDQQTAQRVGHRMEIGHFLHKDDVQDREQNIDPGNMKNDLFSFLMVYSLLKDEKIKDKFKGGKKVV